MATKPRKMKVLRTWPSDFLSAALSSGETERTAETFSGTFLAAAFFASLGLFSSAATCAPVAYAIGPVS